MFKKIITVFLVISVFFGFFYVNEKINYPLHVKLRDSFVEHPEFIPKVKFVKITSGGFENIIADYYWLYSIQYIGKNAVSGEFKKYLYALLNFVTDLNPNFTYPYQIGELILPTTSKNEEISKKDEIKHTEEARDLGLKGIKNNCDLKKIEKIKNESDLKKIWGNEEYKNSCTDSMIPYHLAYIYYWGLKDAKNASFYYKVTGTNEGAPTGARTMAAIMAGKSGDRQKAIIMFLSLAESIDANQKDPNKQGLCGEFSKILKNILAPVLFNDDFFSNLNGTFVKKVEESRGTITKQLGEENVDFSAGRTENYCSYYLNKATRELNLGYIEGADKKFFNDFKFHALIPEDLFKKGYINYIPVDFQKVSKGQGIVYFFNDDINNWDYKMDLLR
ncbi:MAG: hypothetical protein PHF46_03210 [Candidatus Gracilibacteria bacterium]|nr:hypothetical protein [Candidatus Gracilibacteria bacterium]MDD3120388.1 hypothetical protein [Candidatus Gracilibacteria bacterium]MDD4530498.1 hypothetical protein [Candidatus Gracilibacteria bacterium]